MQGMLDRCIAKRLEKSISHNPAVALLGARQFGKTTLAQRIAENTLKGCYGKSRQNEYIAFTAAP